MWRKVKVLEIAWITKEDANPSIPGKKFSSDFWHDALVTSNILNSINSSLFQCRIRINITVDKNTEKILTRKHCKKWTTNIVDVEAKKEWNKRQKNSDI